ncbi:MAG: DUF2905 domain-containing protein [Dehalococcoidia bacterium]|nr:DUF2905 domain-containing protein [Dehalococcoidia bacterium]
MDERSTGFLIAALGAAAVVIGLLVAAGALSWFGRLPGDIRYDGGNVRVFAPITTMIIVSVVLSIALYIARRLF